MRVCNLPMSVRYRMKQLKSELSYRLSIKGDAPEEENTTVQEIKAEIRVRVRIRRVKTTLRIPTIV
jgi:hypothetical protein